MAIISNNERSRGQELDIGRILVTRPVFGQLDVYVKKDGNRGATVICERDGGKYGVTLTILKLFPEAGTYTGWAYVDAQRELAFRFVSGDRPAQPKPLLAIVAAGGRVEVPDDVVGGLSFQHGVLVAFYARFAASNGRAAPRRRATRIFPLDAERLPLVAKLITGDRLEFPDHLEVLEVFFNAIVAAKETVQDRMLLDTALAKLAAHPAVPAELQALARVEQLKIGGAGRGDTGNPRSQKWDAVVQRLTVAKPKQSREGSAKQVTPGDVINIKLQLD